MQVFKDYKKYQAHLGEYEQWKNNLEQTEVKRSRYIKANNLKLSAEDKQRAQALLNAIDTMDEFSQSNAEEMEAATETIQGGILCAASLAGTYLVLKTLTSRNFLGNWIDKIISKHPKLGSGAASALAIGISFLMTALPAVPLISWAASKQVGASRKGRMQAMNKELQNPALFAVLTPEQQKEAEKIAETMPADENMEKAVKARMGKGSRTGGTLKQAWSLLTNNDTYQKQKKEFNEKLKKHEAHFNEALSPEQIEKAKKDQQLLARVVEKMDYASQEYAEKTELATNTIQAAAFLGGGINGWIASKITPLFKSNSPWIKHGIPAAAWLGTTLSLSMLAAKIQKQASRVGRYQVKKELLNNPEQLIYIDEKKLPEGQVKIPEKKKEGFFSFLGRIIKENREYNQHIKKTGMQTMKKQKALEKIKLSDKQIKDAKTLQMNIFKTFNRVDDKSQKYAESVEAAGSLLELPVNLISQIAGLGLGYLFAGKDLKNIKIKEHMPLEDIVKNLIKPVGKFALPSIILGFAAKIGLDAVFTKKQIQASRTADMLALKELSDYRHYADYDSRPDSAENAAAQRTVRTAAKTSPKSSNLLESYLK